MEDAQRPAPNTTSRRTSEFASGDPLRSRTGASHCPGFAFADLVRQWPELIIRGMGASDFLRRELGRRQDRNSRYSLRAFARDLACDHATLSQWLRGARPMS